MKTLTLALALMLPSTALATPLRSSFTPSDPLAYRQWYLAQDRAFESFPGELPDLAPVKVAIVDSGIDGGHPEFKNRIAAARSFVGGSPFTDEEGHGTFVAGMIAAAINNNEGIAGMAFPAQLVIAKIAGGDETIDVEDEAAAIRWAADMGAQVINLSIGGLRDPFNQRRDTFSTAEATAIEYAYKRGAVLVAAIGNADEAPRIPWPYASYPAALPHVIGVSALTPSGNVPTFSDRDKIYNDIAAPGQEIFSTLPYSLTSFRPLCVNQGYSDCGPEEFKHAAGTSFAAPQVSAAAAVLLALRPTLSPDQVSFLLERYAADVNATTGCKQCPALRDAYSGWGRLDVAKAIAALDGPLPALDRLEPNDDAGSHAVTISNSTTSLSATVDFWDDQIDVYKLRLKRGQRLSLRLRGPAGATTNLLLWRPRTVRVSDLRGQHLRAAQSLKPGSSHSLAHRAKSTGWYYVEVKVTTPAWGPYKLTIRRTQPRRS